MRGLGPWGRVAALAAAAVVVGTLLGTASRPSPAPGSSAGRSDAVSVVAAEPRATARRQVTAFGWAASLTAGLPADLPGALASASCRPVDHAPGWLARENARPGNGSWRTRVTVRQEIVGYLGQTTAVCGQRVDLHLSGPRGQAVVRVFRVGWYGGTRARLVWTSSPVRVSPQRQARPSGSTRLIQETWPTATTIPVTPSFEPGLYLVEFGSEHGGAMGVAPLVVRDPGATDPVLVQLSAATWAAYNTYGGGSLYRGPGASTALRSFAAGLDRPLAADGLRELMVRDVALVHQIERLGLDTAYVTDFDVDAAPSLLLTPREIVVPGHAEYWTARMLRGLEAARNLGVNEAWLGGNDVSWQIRITRSADGRPTTVVCYRTLADPVAATDPAAATVNWWSNPGPVTDVGALIGERYTGRRMDSGLRMRSAPPWLVDGTGLRVGSLLASAAANEVNGVTTLRGLPPDLQVVAEGAFRRGRLLGPVDVTYYTAPSGAAVFSAGTTDWGCEIDGSCVDHWVASSEASVLGRLTGNVLKAFTQPGFGRSHPSVLTPPTELTLLARSLPAAQVGTAGRPE